MKGYLFIVISFFFLGCESYQLDDCFSSAGEEKTEIRILNDFDRVRIGQKFDLQILQDTAMEPSVSITCGSNLLEGVECEVSEGVLEIKNRNTCNFVRSFKDRIQITLTLKDLRELTVSGDVFVRSIDTLFLTELNVIQSALNDIDLTLHVEERVLVNSINSRRVILHGKAGKLEGSIEEISDLIAKDLVCREVLIDSHTPLDCSINATELIFVKIFNAGNIFYFQEPSGLKEVNVQEGNGKLIKMP